MMDYSQQRNTPEIGFDKAIRVIDSCKNIYHVKAARNYVNLFFKNYSSSSGINIFTPSYKVDSLYNQLLFELIKAEKRFETT